MEDKKSVGIWIRVSTDMQAMGDSPEHHELRARYYAEEKGWEVAEVYHLEGFSGESILEYPQTKKMLQDVEQGKISTLVFSKLARLGRNTLELLIIAEHFRTHNAILVGLDERLDINTPEGRQSYTQKAANAQYEREETSSRVAANVPIRATLGKPLGGQAPFGYRWEGTAAYVGGHKVIKDHKFVINEKEAPVRKLIYELFLEHRRKKTVSRLLNEMGHRTRNGSLFSDTTVDRLIRDSTAKGERIANYTKSGGKGKQWIIKPKSDWITVSCPAIVEEQLWQACNDILDEQYDKRRKPGPKSVHLLAGFVYCTCGNKMYVFHENNKYACKPCKNRIPAADLDEIYHTQLKTFVLAEADVAKYIEQNDRRIQEKEALLFQLTEEGKKVRTDMDSLMRLRIDQEVSKEYFAQYFKPLERRMEQIEVQLPKLEFELGLLKKQTQSPEKYLEDSNDLHGRWPELSFEEQRIIVETITERITVGNGEIAISLAHIPTLSQTSENGNASSWIHRSHQHKA